MDSRSASQLARELGTTTPRLLRAVRRLGLHPARGKRGALRLTGADARRLADELGVAVAIPGLRRSQVLALAALARAPMGLRSVRALARASGLSPTAAGIALGELLDLGLAETRQQTVAEARARTVDIVYANLAAPRWPDLAPLLARVVLRPVVPPVGRRVPARLGHTFWNAPPGQIDLAAHGPYVAGRVLRDGDTQALAWAAQALTAADWNSAARARGLAPRQRALAANLAASLP